MIKKLIDSDDYMLHNKVKSCSYDLDRHELSKILIENMLHYDGVGLSANQIGIEERAFCMMIDTCLLYTSPSPRDRTRSRMPSSA